MAVNIWSYIFEVLFQVNFQLTYKRSILKFVWITINFIDFVFFVFSKQINAGAVVLTDCTYWFVIFPFLTIKDYNLSFVSTVALIKTSSLYYVVCLDAGRSKMHNSENCCILHFVVLMEISPPPPHKKEEEEEERL